MRQRQSMQYGICAAAHGHIQGKGVINYLRINDLAGGQVILNQG